MLALKLASLAQGASGVRLETVAMLEAMLARDLVPLVPGQCSVGASGDLAPLAHMAAAMIGVGDMLVAGGERMPAREALQRHGLQTAGAGEPKEGLALLNGTQFSTANALAALFEGRQSVPGRADYRRSVHGSRQGLRRALRCACARAAGRIPDSARAPRHCRP